MSALNWSGAENNWPDCENKALFRQNFKNNFQRAQKKLLVPFILQERQSRNAASIE